MESSNGRRERRHQIEIETAGERQPIEKLILVETVHLDEPVNRLTFAAKLQPSTYTPSDRHDSAIDARRGSPVETDLRLAHLPSSLYCGEVEIVESNRAFELVGALPCQEHYRRVRIGALHVLAVVRGRLRQKLNDGGLIFGLHRHSPLRTRCQDCSSSTTRVAAAVRESLRLLCRWWPPSIPGCRPCRQSCFRPSRARRGGSSACPSDRPSAFPRHTHPAGNRPRCSGRQWG